jgi:hypothetical protein
MTRILVMLEDGAVIWNEGVSAADFETEHFRRALADRLGWAVADADTNAAAPTLAAMQAMSSPAPPSSSHALAGVL